MTFLSNQEFPVKIDVRVRQEDLGRNGEASTIGMARWLEDARIRLRLPRFERLLASGGFGPYNILLVGQGINRLAPAGSTGAQVHVHTGISRVGRSSFTYEQAIVAGDTRVGRGDATVVLASHTGPLQLPDELLADLADLQLSGTVSAAARPSPQRLERDHYAYWAPLHSRIGDVDSNQHVNFVALATWYDEAVAAFTTHSIGTGAARLVPDLPPWSYQIQYLREVTYPGEYEIGLLAWSADTESVHYELGIFRDSTCLGVADAVGPRGDLTDVAVQAAKATD